VVPPGLEVNCGKRGTNCVYELVVGRQEKKKGVSSWLRQGSFNQAKEKIEKRGTPAHGNE